ncbi:MAG: hypothetical protein KC503_38035 [Myxococcales bacterium]|nr:hypothetical protein [Myxococcales bacterium]
MYGLTKAPLVLALLVALVGVLAGGCDRIARYYGYDAGARPEDAAKDATGDLDAPSEMRVGDLPIDGPPGDTMPPDCSGATRSFGTALVGARFFAATYELLSRRIWVAGDVVQNGRRVPVVAAFDECGVLVPSSVRMIPRMDWRATDIIASYRGLPTGLICVSGDNGSTQSFIACLDRDPTGLPKAVRWQNDAVTPPPPLAIADISAYVVMLGSRGGAPVHRAFALDGSAMGNELTITETGDVAGFASRATAASYGLARLSGGALMPALGIVTFQSSCDWMSCSAQPKIYTATLSKLAAFTLTPTRGIWLSSSGGLNQGVSIALATDTPNSATLSAGTIRAATAVKNVVLAVGDDGNGEVNIWRVNADMTSPSSATLGVGGTAHDIIVISNDRVAFVGETNAGDGALGICVYDKCVPSP